jgi:uncharacterized membrane protein YfcA
VTVALFGIVVLMTHFVEGLTGFGSTALALPFCVMLVGVKTAVPVLIILRLILSACIVFIDYKNIVWKSYLIIFAYLPEEILMKILGVFMIMVAARGIYFSFNERAVIRLAGKRALNVMLFLGGSDPWGVQCRRAVGCHISNAGSEG